MMPVPPLRTLIVDDEPVAREVLRDELAALSGVEIVGEAANGNDALRDIARLQPDLVFLDLQMPRMGGFDVIRSLPSGVQPVIIIVTAYDQYAIRAFEAGALDYLLKPVEQERLELTVERARKAIAEKMAASAPVTPLQPPDGAARTPQRTKLLVKSGGRNLIVDAQDVVYATIDDGVITLVASNVEGESNYRTIEELQSNLDPEIFWRVHRSFLVNINRIREVIPWFKSSFQLRMDDRKHTEIPVSRVQTKRLRALLKL
jgi:two-component system LytT family response regulator/two-component system response regulator LytT